MATFDIKIVLVGHRGSGEFVALLPAPLLLTSLSSLPHTAAGKSALLQRLLTDRYQEQEPTYSCEFGAKRESTNELANAGSAQGLASMPVWCLVPTTERNLWLGLGNVSRHSLAFECSYVYVLPPHCVFCCRCWCRTGWQEMSQGTVAMTSAAEQKEAGTASPAAFGTPLVLLASTPSAAGTRSGGIGPWLHTEACSALGMAMSGCKAVRSSRACPAAATPPLLPATAAALSPCLQICAGRRCCRGVL